MVFLVVFNFWLVCSCSVGVVAGGLGACWPAVGGALGRRAAYSSQFLLSCAKLAAEVPLGLLGCGIGGNSSVLADTAFGFASYSSGRRCELEVLVLAPPTRSLENMAERKGAAKRCVTSNGPAIVVPSRRHGFTNCIFATPQRRWAQTEQPSTVRCAGRRTAAAQRSRRRRRRLLARATLVSHTAAG